MLIGANFGSFSEIQKSLLFNMTVMRSYGTPADSIPAVFPVYPRGVVPVQSFKPDIRKFNSGTYDAVFSSLVKSAPAGSYITLWHEGERHNENHAASMITEMHEHAHALADQSNPKVNYGQIFTTYSAETGRIEDWTAPGMDFYGLDVYATAEDDTAGDCLYETINTIREVTNRVNLIITECNSLFTNSRQGFITSCYQLALDFDCKIFMVYYDPDTDTNSPYKWTSAVSDRFTMNQVIKP
jgi:hypothetical protein